MMYLKPSLYRASLALALCVSCAWARPTADDAVPEVAGEQPAAREPSLPPGDDAVRGRVAAWSGTTSLAAGSVRGAATARRRGSHASIR